MRKGETEEILAKDYAYMNKIERGGEERWWKEEKENKGIWRNRKERKKERNEKIPNDYNVLT